MLNSIIYDINVSNDSTEDVYNWLYQTNFTCRWFEAQSHLFGALYLPFVPLLMPNNSLYQSPQMNIVSNNNNNSNINIKNFDACYQLMDRDGMVVKLPYNTRAQLARYFALSGNRIQFLCRSSIERVFYNEPAGPYHPKELWTASFDLVWPQEYSSATVIPYTEMFCFTTQILAFFLPLSSINNNNNNNCYLSSEFSTSSTSMNVFNEASSYTLVYHLTNLSIFQAICDYLHISRLDYQTIIRLLVDNMESIIRQSFDEFRLALKMQLVRHQSSEASFDLLCQLLAITATAPAELLTQIRSMLVRTHKTQSVNEFLRNKVEPLITEMTTVHRLWSAGMASTSKNNNNYQSFSSGIVFRFSLSCVSPTTFFYNHIIVHAILEQQQKPISLVAIGGRYDMMINGYKTLYQQAEEEVALNEATNRITSIKAGLTGQTSSMMMNNDDSLWPSWRLKGNSVGEIVDDGDLKKQNDDNDNNKNDYQTTLPEKVTSYQLQPFQSKFALGISFSVDKLARYFGQTTETVINDTFQLNKFRQLSPFHQYGGIESLSSCNNDIDKKEQYYCPSLIDLIIAPVVALPVVCRLAQSFRSHGLRVTILPELQGQTASASSSSNNITRLEDNDTIIEMINTYAENVQVRFVLLIDQQHSSSQSAYQHQQQPQSQIGETIFVLREFGNYHINQSSTITRPGRWNSLYFGSSETRMVEYIFNSTIDGQQQLIPKPSLSTDVTDGINGLLSHLSSGNNDNVSGGLNNNYNYQQRHSSFGDNLGPSPLDTGNFSSTSSTSSAIGIARTNRSSSLSVTSCSGSLVTTTTVSSSSLILPSTMFPTYTSSSISSMNITLDLDFISTNKGSDRRRLTNSINAFVLNRLPSLNPSYIRVLAIDVPYHVIKTVSDIVDSDLLTDLVSCWTGGSGSPLINDHSAITSFDSSGGSFSNPSFFILDQPTLENLKTCFLSLFNELKSRSKRDIVDNIERLSEELWSSIRRKLIAQQDGNNSISISQQRITHQQSSSSSLGVNCATVIVLIAYREGILKYRLVSL